MRTILTPVRPSAFVLSFAIACTVREGAKAPTSPGGGSADNGVVDTAEPSPDPSPDTGSPLDSGTPADTDTSGDTGGSPCEDTDDFDCDGLDNTLEDDLGTDPYDTDSDDDGLSDYEELIDTGTDPTLADSDGDGLEDGQEISSEQATDPLLFDTDGDDFSDGDETDAGTDPNDPASHPTPPVWINTPIMCTTVDKVSAYHFADPAYYSTLFPDGSGAEVGYECHCRVQVEDSTLTPVTGITVWTPTSAHALSKWVTSTTNPPNPRPRGVYVEGPSWLATATSTGAPILDGEVAVNDRNFDADGDGVSETVIEAWLAYNADERTLDMAFPIGSTTPVDVSGDYDIYLSMVNPEGTNIVSCSSFAYDSTIGEAVHFSVDYYPSAPFAPSPSPLLCRPGRSGSTHFRLTDAGHGRSLAVATDGSPTFIGAEVGRIAVTNWRGADRLEATAPGGGSWVLDTAHPSLRLAPADLTFHNLTWRASRSSSGSFQDPDIVIDHRCGSLAPPPAPPASSPLPVAPSWPLTWGEADQALRGATGGFSLTQAGLPLTHADWPVFRLRRVHGGTGWSDKLQLEAEGAGVLIELPLTYVEEEWRFKTWGRLGKVTGTVAEGPQGLHIHINSGRLDSPMGAIDLQSFDLHVGVPLANN